MSSTTTVSSPAPKPRYKNSGFILNKIMVRSLDLLLLQLFSWFVFSLG